MKKVLITEFMEQDSVDKMSENFDVTYDTCLHENQAKLSSLIANTNAVIVRNKTQLTEDLLSKAKQLTFIGRLGVGLDNIDTDYLTMKHMKVLKVKSKIKIKSKSNTRKGVCTLLLC